jgi:hypothetical protein
VTASMIWPCEAIATIPVLRVLDILVIRGRVWPDGSGERESCMSQLAGHVDQVRSLFPPEPGNIQAVDGTGCVDDRLYGTWGQYVPQTTPTLRNLSQRLVDALGEPYSLTLIWVLRISSGKMAGLPPLLMGMCRLVPRVLGLYESISHRRLFAGKSVGDV